MGRAIPLLGGVVGATSKSFRQMQSATLPERYFAQRRQSPGRGTLRCFPSLNGLRSRLRGRFSTTHPIAAPALAARVLRLRRTSLTICGGYWNPAR